MELSLRWAERCKAAFGEQPGKAMFGIVQGGDVARLRERSAQSAEPPWTSRAMRSAGLRSASRRR